MSGAPRRVVSRFARVAFRVVRATPIGRLVAHPSVERLRSRLLHMGADDVHAALAALSAEGVPAWLGGGWGIDALLGEQTRRHGDIDLLVDEADEGARRSCHALSTLGYEPAPDQGETGGELTSRMILRDPSGRTIELLFFRSPGNAPQPGNPSPELATGAFAEGSIEGRSVPCLSPAEQLRFHRAYEPAPHDRRDMALLCQRFALEIPPEYRTR